MVMVEYVVSYSSLQKYEMVTVTRPCFHVSLESLSGGMGTSREILKKQGTMSLLAKERSFSRIYAAECRRLLPSVWKIVAVPFVVYEGQVNTDLNWVQSSLAKS